MVFRCSRDVLLAHGLHAESVLSWWTDEKWSDLTERAYRKFLKRHGTSRHEQLVVRAQFAELSRLFAAHMLDKV